MNKFTSFPFVNKYFQLIFLAFSLISTPIVGQENKKTGLNNSFSTPIVFFGYDFSHLKLLDKKREVHELDNFIHRLSMYLYKTIPLQEMKILLHEDQVVYNLTYTHLINDQIADSTILSNKRSRINKDSLQTYVNNLNIPDKPGTGFIIIYECFQRRSDTTTAYLVFFDTETKNVLHNEYIQIHDANGYAPLTDWNKAAFAAAVRLIKAYSSKAELSKKFPDRYKIFSNPDSLSSFKSGFFKNSIDELPITFGINPGCGFSTSFFSAGIHMNADFYHILVGVRASINPIMDFMADESHTETAFYAGYRYRKNRDSFSIGLGVGKMEVKCTSGLSSDCYNFKDEEVQTVPLFIEYAYFPSPFIGFTISGNAAFSKRSSPASLLIGIKFGIARRPGEFFAK